MKFKVGDKVKFNKGNEVVAESYDYNPKKTYEVIETMEETGTIRIINELGKKLAFSEWRFDLYKPKPTKKQRIAALEERTAKQDEEIAELKTIVHQLRESNITIDDVKQHFDIKATPSIVEDKPKTANELRAEIIEKAKGFVDDLINKTCPEGFMAFGGLSLIPYFTQNEEKRIVNVVIKGAYSNWIRYRGTAKCNPSDVFNAHIGKAIALGRALELDVSEFEQAVQPTEVVVGMVIQEYYKFKEECITEIDGVLNFEYVNEKLECYRKGILNRNNFNARIINDTNAIYGGVE